MNSHFELLSLSHLLQDFYIVLSVGASWLPTAQYRSTTCKQQFANQQSPSGCSCTIHHLHYQQCNTAIERMSNKSWWQRGGRFKLVWANNTGFWLVHWSLNQVLNQKFRELLSHPVQKDSKHAVLERHREKLQENFSWPLTILLELKVHRGWWWIGWGVTLLEDSEPHLRSSHLISKEEQEPRAKTLLLSTNFPSFSKSW